MSDTTDLAGVPGMKRVELTQADIDKWAPHAERIRGHLSIAAGEMINIGKYLIEVKTGLDHGKFLHWIWREFEMTDRTARRFMSVAAWVEGKSDTVSNLQPSVLYLLASSETPSEITDDVITRAEKGENIKAAEVKRQIQKAKAESTNVATTEGEAPETEVSIDSAIAYFKEPATSREHGIRKIREYEAFADHVAADAARAAQEECPEPEVLPPEPKPSEGPPKKPRRSRQEIERDAFFEGRLPVLEQAAGKRRLVFDSYCAESRSNTRRRPARSTRRPTPRATHRLRLNCRGRKREALND